MFSEFWFWIKANIFSQERFFRAILGTSATLDEYALQVQTSIVKVRQTGEEVLNKNVTMIKGT